MSDIHRLPRCPLGFFPTPLVGLRRLGGHLGGPRLFMKRDDQSGLAFGGNKTRKLEFLVGEALALGCDTLVTGGAGQSNHCRQTAAAAAACGLGCHLVLGGEAPAEPRGNLLLDRLLGAQIHWCGGLRKGERIPAIVEDLRRAGRKPYVIPYGGSNPLGAAGFVEAIGELQGQLAAAGLAITHLVFPSSSGGTHAGLLVGCRLHGLACRVVGIAIDKDETGGVPLADHIAALAVETALRHGIRWDGTSSGVTLDDRYLGGGYGVVGEIEREAIELTARLEGVLLDPVYTGRAMGGLIDMIRRGEFAATDCVLFWHTGGAPALFA